jgi:hypothetical protein
MKTWLFIPGGRDDFFGRSFEPFPVGDGHTAYEWAMALARSSALIDAGDLFRKRRQLGDAWAKFCATPAPAGRVVAVRRAL